MANWVEFHSAASIPFPGFLFAILEEDAKARKRVWELADESVREMLVWQQSRAKSIPDTDRATQKS
jgi:hypothetical protein